MTTSRSLGAAGGRRHHGNGVENEGNQHQDEDKRQKQRRVRVVVRAERGYGQTRVAKRVGVEHREEDRPGPDVESGQAYQRKIRKRGEREKEKKKMRKSLVVRAHGLQAK